VLPGLAEKQQGGEQQEGPGARRPGGRVAQITLAEAHELPLVVLLDVGAPLLVVAGRPLQALPLCRDPEIVVTKVFILTLQNLVTCEM
jgi:hypothetical protein